MQVQYLYVIVQLVIGLMTFATVLGYVVKCFWINLNGNYDDYDGCGDDDEGDN